jgi:hypothetical protein
MKKVYIEWNVWVARWNTQGKQVGHLTLDIWNTFLDILATIDMGIHTEI